jgi:hypothetical protein
MAKYIKDLDQYLTQQSGLDKAEREQWRKAVGQLMDKAKKIKDPIKATAAKAEAVKVFSSMSYWKTNYKNK